MKSWFTIDGTLEQIDFPGPSHLRFPLELATFIVETYSKPNDWIIDPFCGFGTSIVAGQQLGRRVIGFERNVVRGEFAARRSIPPSRVIIDDIRRISHYALPQFDLLFTSPPFTTLSEHAPACQASYLEDFRLAFTQLVPFMCPEGKIVVELSNVRHTSRIRTVLWDAGKILSSIFHLETELVRCNTGKETATAGFDHSTLLIFRMR